MALIGELELLLPETATEVGRTFERRDRSCVSMLDAPLSTIHRTLLVEAGEGWVGAETPRAADEDEDESADEVMRWHEDCDCGVETCERDIVPRTLKSGSNRKHPSHGRVPSSGWMHNEQSEPCSVVCAGTSQCGACAH